LEKHVFPIFLQTDFPHVVHVTSTCSDKAAYLSQQCQLAKARSLANAGQLIVLFIVDAELTLLNNIEAIPWSRIKHMSELSQHL
jgi:hypothetical protein